jgi:zinc transport system permease protein
MVFLCGGITHASFGGIGVAFYFGLNPILGAMLFAIFSAMGIEWSSSRSKIRQDSAIGVMWGLGMAIGALFIYLTPGYASGNMASFLFGSIVAVTQSDIIALAALSAALLVGSALWHRQVMYVAFDREFARASGVKVGVVSYVMAVITAVAIVLSIRVMGIILLMRISRMSKITGSLFPSGRIPLLQGQT